MKRTLWILLAILALAALLRFFQLDAQLGMIKINPKDNRVEPIYSDKSSVKNTGFGLSVGYRF